MPVRGIKDFGKVDEYLHRGAQPKPEGIEQLKKLAIDTIVDWRGERGRPWWRKNARTRNRWECSR